MPPQVVPRVRHPPMPLNEAGNRAPGLSSLVGPGRRLVVSPHALDGPSTSDPPAPSLRNAGCRRPAPGSARTRRLRPQARRAGVALRRAGGRVGSKPSQVANLNHLSLSSNSSSDLSVVYHPPLRPVPGSRKRPQAPAQRLQGHGRRNPPGNCPSATGLALFPANPGSPNPVRAGPACPSRGWAKGRTRVAVARAPKASR